jgi:hypothetical protein
LLRLARQAGIGQTKSHQLALLVSKPVSIPLVASTVPPLTSQESILSLAALIDAHLIRERENSTTRKIQTFVTQNLPLSVINVWLRIAKVPSEPIDRI